MRILAIDLGKDKSACCLYDSGTGDYSLTGMDTTAVKLVKLLDRTSPDRVVMEVSPLAGWVGDVVRSRGIELEVANPTHEAWRWKNVKRKSDRDDALKLAQLSAMKQLPTVHLPERPIRQWRSLIAYRHNLVARRTRIKNRIRAILAREEIRMPSGRSGWSSPVRAFLARLAQPIDAAPIDGLWQAELHLELEQLASVERAVADVEWKLDRVAEADGRVQQLRSIPGVGPRLAETVVAIIDRPGRFRNAKQVGAYVGLTPRRFQSSSMDRQGRISGEGNALLRSLLVEVSWLSLRHNPWAREVFERVGRRTKSRKKIAIVAVARRLLIRCWAMLRDNRSWNPPLPQESMSMV